jgi:hypothetical protein
MQKFDTNSDVSIYEYEYGLQTVFHTKFVDMFTFDLHTKFRMADITDILKPKYSFLATTMLLYTLLRLLLFAPPPQPKQYLHIFHICYDAALHCVTVSILILQHLVKTTIKWRFQSDNLTLPNNTGTFLLGNGGGVIA